MNFGESHATVKLMFYLSQIYETGQNWLNEKKIK